MINREFRAMTKLRKDIRITEVSSVDDAANPNAQVLMLKHADGGTSTVDLGWNESAKRAFIEKLGPPFEPSRYGGSRQPDDPGDPPGHFRPERYAGTSPAKPKLPKKTKKPPNNPKVMFNSLVPAKTLGPAALYKRMVVLAAAQQTPDQTPEAAFAKFITEDPQGRSLYEAYRSADPDDDGPDDDADPVTSLVGTSKAYDAMMAKAEVLAKRDGITIAQAFEKVYTSPTNAGLVAVDKAFDSVGPSPADPGPRGSVADTANVQRKPKAPRQAPLAPTDTTPESSYDYLMALAEKYAAENGISVEAAFATISSQHPDLFATAKRHTVSVTETPNVVAKAQGPSLDALNDLRDEIMAKNASLTSEQAFERAMAHPRGRQLYAKYRQELLG